MILKMLLILFFSYLFYVNNKVEFKAYRNKIMMVVSLVLVAIYSFEVVLYVMMQV